MDVWLTNQFADKTFRRQEHLVGEQVQSRGTLVVKANHYFSWTKGTLVNNKTHVGYRGNCSVIFYERSKENF